MKISVGINSESLVIRASCSRSWKKEENTEAKIKSLKMNRPKYKKPSWFFKYSTFETPKMLTHIKKEAKELKI